MRRFVKLVALLACTVWCPAAAYAQASITGVVRDTSGRFFLASPSKRPVTS